MLFEAFAGLCVDTLLVCAVLMWFAAYKLYSLAFGSSSGRSYMYVLLAASICVCGTGCLPLAGHEPLAAKAGIMLDRHGVVRDAALVEIANGWEEAITVNVGGSVGSEAGILSVGLDVPKAAEKFKLDIHSIPIDLGAYVGYNPECFDFEYGICAMLMRVRIGGGDGSGVGMQLPEPDLGEVQYGTE